MPAAAEVAAVAEEGAVVAVAVELAGLAEPVELAEPVATMAVADLVVLSHRGPVTAARAAASRAFAVQPCRTGQSA